MHRHFLIFLKKKKNGFNIIIKNAFSVFWAQIYNFLLILYVFTAGAAGPRLFTIHQIDANANNLPKAHTW